MIPSVLSFLVLTWVLISIREPRDTPTAMIALDALEKVIPQTYGQTVASLAASISCATTGITIVAFQKGEALRRARKLLFASLALLACGLITSTCYPVPAENGRLASVVNTQSQ
jgi:hypothetical protein